MKQVSIHSNILMNWQKITIGDTYFSNAKVYWKYFKLNTIKTDHIFILSNTYDAPYISQGQIVNV